MPHLKLHARPLRLVLGAMFAVSLASLPSITAAGSTAAPKVPSLATLEKYISTSVKIQNAPPSSGTYPPYLSLSFSQTIWPRTYVSPCYVYNAVKKVPPNPRAACSFGDVAAKRMILLTGDSQAGSWLAALNTFGETSHWRIVFMAMAKCAPWGSGASGDVILYGSVTAQDCDNFREGVLVEARHMHPNVVALIGNGFGSQSTLTSQVLSIARKYEATGAKVLFFRPVPQYLPYVTSASPVNCLLLHGSDVPGCLQPPSVVINGEYVAAFRAVAPKVHGSLIDTTPLFCSKSKCAIYVFDGSKRRMINSDNTHINYYYSAWIGTALGQLLKSSLPATT